MTSLAALRADHENAAAAGFRSAAGHESLTKGHEILVAPKDGEKALAAGVKLMVRSWQAVLS